MCKQCDKIQTKAADSPRASRSRLSKLFNDPQHPVKEWKPIKWCPKCEQEVPKSGWRKNARKRPDGRTYYDFRAHCKDCESKQQRHDYRNDYNKRAVKLLQGVRSRCKNKDLDYDLNTEWLVKVFNEGVCQVTGLPFEFEVDSKCNGFRSFTPSLDRTDPTKGYTEDNVKVVVWLYNAAKGVGTHEDVMKLAEALINE